MLPLLAGLAPFAAAAYLKSQPKQGAPGLPGPTDADVLASDLRIRRSLARQNRSTFATGGLGGTPSRVMLPTLIGT